VNLPTTYEAVLIFGIVFVPGFLFLEFGQRSVPHTRESLQVRDFLWMLASGATIHLVSLILPFGTPKIINWYTDRELGSHLSYLGVWTFLVILVLPVVAGMLSGWILARPLIDQFLGHFGLSFVDRMPSAWDFVFWRRQGGWVKVYLDDEPPVAGFFGEGSSVSTRASRRDLFLEQAWNLDDKGNLRDPVSDSIGMWIAHDHIRRLEFFKPGDEHDEQDAIATVSSPENDPDQA